MTLVGLWLWLDIATRLCKAGGKHTLTIDDLHMRVEANKVEVVTPAAIFFKMTMLNIQ